VYFRDFIEIIQRKDNLMTRGRPPLGPNLVEHFDADPNTKDRLQVLLQTLSGELSVPDACQKLAISQARFFELRNTMLQAALDSLQPKSAGRPPHHIDPASQRIQQLEQQNQDLRVHLAAAQLREEIALAMPNLSTRDKPARKKTTGPAPKRPPASSSPTIRRNSQNSDCSTHGSTDT
jgi:hypothetical protein